MKTMKTMKFTLALALAFLMTIPMAVSAQEGPRHRAGERGMERGNQLAEHINPRHLMRSAEQLGLNEGQKEAIAGIIESHREEVEPVREQLRQEAGTLRELMGDSRADRQRILAAHERVQQLELQMKRHRVEMFLDLRDVLTVEQREQARELVQSRGERRQQMQERRQRGGDDGERPQRPRQRQQEQR